mmetsp:Transcript_37541/g.65965  ORF Transcript_37541/g.65965 Transcript_37541/m.65965 type:complete len:200 (-) Transcript_37541:12-611(-)
MKLSTLAFLDTKPAAPSNLQLVCCALGTHWWGWQPSRLEMDEVAKRVCPWKKVAPSSSGCVKRLRRPLFALSLPTNKSESSVRLPLTTRVRTPRTAPPWPSYVTTPADCAPRTMVTRSISRIKWYARLRLTLVRMRRPKLPQKKAPLSASGCMRRSEVIASRAVQEVARSTEGDVCGRRRNAKTRPTLKIHPMCRTMLE